MLSDGARMACNNNSYARVQLMGAARVQTSTIRYLWWMIPNVMYIHGSQFSIVFFSSSSPYLVFFPAQMKGTSLHSQIMTNDHTRCKARVVKHTNINMHTLTFPNDLKIIPMTNNLITTPKAIILIPPPKKNKPCPEHAWYSREGGGGYGWVII